MTKTPLVQPPRLAVWFVNLFTSYERSEFLFGDLLEEFSDIASTSGDAFARRWYWRQSMKTVAHLIVAGFLDMPWLTAGTVVGGWLLCWVLDWTTTHAVVAIHYKYQVYAHIDAYLFWLIYAVLIQRFIEPLFIGCVIALVAKSREMVVTMTLGLIIGASSGVELAYFRLLWSEPNFRLAWLLTTFVSPVMFVIGGGIVREIRSANSHRRLAAHR